ncbi:glycosyltransferase family 4 protein [Advenella sp. RU8]|uniref:glycosyltransferase family 4 protein n=1 Tax=Advenella sp. RU8 TaxID=3399575 RepID=UPI003AADED45
MLFIHSLRGGGAERVAVDLAARWIAGGHDVLLVTQTDASEDAYELNKQVQRISLNTAGLQGVMANLRRLYILRKEIKRQRPDIVIGFMTTSSILAVLAASGVAGCHVIATEHTHPPSQTISGLWQKLRRYTYPKAAKVIALTHGTKAWLEKNVPGSNIAVIPNAVHWPLENKEPFIECVKAPGRKLMLGVGRLHHDKGFDMLIKAFVSIAHLHPEWDLIILGEGDKREALQKQLDEAGMGSRISMPGRAGNMLAWSKAADIYVLSSRTEGLSNSLLEAMACGVPSIAFDCDTGPREIIRPGLDGVLVKPAEDEEALAAQMSALMFNQAKQAELGKRAIDVRDRFSMRRIAGLWQDVFNEVLHDKKDGKKG